MEPEEAEQRADADHSEFVFLNDLRIAVGIGKEDVFRNPLVIDADPVTD